MMTSVGVPAHPLPVFVAETNPPVAPPPPTPTPASASARGGENSAVESTMGRVYSSSNSAGRRSGTSGRGSSGSEAPPRGSALAKFRAVVTVVKVHGFLNTLRAAASSGERENEDDDDEEVVSDDVV